MANEGSTHLNCKKYISNNKKIFIDNKEVQIKNIAFESNFILKGENVISDFILETKDNKIYYGEIIVTHPIIYDRKRFLYDKETCIIIDLSDADVNLNYKEICKILYKSNRIMFLDTYLKEKELI